MKSTDSLINFSYLENILKQHKWVSYLVSGLFLVNCILGYSSLGESAGISLYLYFILSYVLLFTIPILLFRVTSSNDSSHLLSLPIKRKQYFFTIYMAGLILIGLPILFMFCSLALMSEMEGSVFDNGNLLVISIFLLFSYYHLSLLACQLAETTAMKGVLIIAFAIIPAFLYYLYQVGVASFSISYILDISWAQSKYVCPIVYGILHFLEYYDMIAFCIHLIILVVCLIFSYLIFTKKQFENVDKFVNNKVKLVFKNIFIFSCTIILYAISSNLVSIDNYSLLNRAKYVLLLIGCVFISDVIIGIMFSSVIKLGNIIKRTLLMTIPLCCIFIAHARYLDYKPINMDHVDELYLNLYEYGFNSPLYLKEYQEKKDEIISLINDFNKEILDSPEHVKKDYSEDLKDIYISLYSTETGEFYSRYYYVDNALYEKLLQHDLFPVLFEIEYQYLLDLCNNNNIVYMDNYETGSLTVLDTAILKELLLELDLNDVLKDKNIWNNYSAYYQYTFVNNDESYSSSFILLNYLSDQYKDLENVYDSDIIQECYEKIIELEAVPFSEKEALNELDFIEFDINNNILSQINYGYVYSDYYTYNISKQSDDDYVFTCQWYFESDTNLASGRNNNDDLDYYNQFADVEMEFKMIDDEMKLIRFEVVRWGA